MPTDKKQAKIIFLKDVLNSKETLFGVLTNKFSKENKKIKWRLIHDKALDLGLVPAYKNYVYTRDTYWQNLKKYTLVSIFHFSFNISKLISFVLEKI